MKDPKFLCLANYCVKSVIMKHIFIIILSSVIGTCDGGLFTFEKTTGHFLRTAQQVPLTLEAASPGITTRCTNLCADEGADCPAFTIDYSGQRCFKLDRNTQVKLMAY